MFDYSSEVLDTDVSAIDAIEDSISTDTMANQFTLEMETATIDAMNLENEFGRIIHDTAGDDVVALETSDMTTSAGVLVTESGEYLIQETYIIGDGTTENNIDDMAQNELFETEDGSISATAANSVLDFSEKNPFGDVGG